MPPDRESLRATLASFDARQKKIVGGVIAVMIEHPQRVREREWITEQFTEIALLACGFEDLDSVADGRDQLQVYVRDNIDPILNACYVLFGFVAEDLTPRLAEGITPKDAVAHALSYMAPETGAS